VLRQLLALYLDGFRAMSVGRSLWKLILIKLFVLFAVLKIFFFPDFLDTRFASDQERSAYVLQQLTGPRSGSEQH
jgi:hypothetical protein